ncbi:MAG: hypothetical protein CTY12_03290 [Methylotenera sp.]|nr:MAG: hypothetical protein CTY12_03290 [Methylotenera sp.]
MCLIHQQLTKHKSFELQANLFDSLSTNTIFQFDISWSIKQDHAGPSCTFILFRVLYFHIMIYDHRHWDWENQKWEET